MSKFMLQCVKPPSHPPCLFQAVLLAGFRPEETAMVSVSSQLRVCGEGGEMSADAGHAL